MKGEIKTQAEANKQTYGRHGASGSSPYDPTLCVERVRDEGRWPDFHQCKRKRGFGPAKLYCRIHDPAEAKKRDKERERKFDHKINLQVVPWEAVNLIKKVKSSADITANWLKMRDSILKRLGQDEGTTP